jgi:hypothetical protein
MRAGQLEHRFRFERRERLAVPGDAHGVTEGGWQVQIAQVPARLVPLRRGEEVLGSRLQGVQPYILTIRSYSATRLIETDWRAVDERTGIAYNIRTVEKPARDHIDLLIDSGGASG